MVCQSSQGRHLLGLISVQQVLGRITIEWGFRSCRVWFWLMFCLLLIERRKKKKRNGQGTFFPGHMPCWQCYARIFWLLGAFKSCVKVSPWILCAPNVLEVIILARSNENFSSVAPTSRDCFWSHRAKEFWSPTLTTILISLLIKVL
jgi:hypothetical protein